MPSCLAIDTATARGGVAVARDGAIVFERDFLSERSHHSQLFAPLGDALKSCRADLRVIVVGTGPGSYTGARIGIAAAQGLALSLNVPVIGLPSVLAPDAGGLPDEFVVCGDARRGKNFTARVCGGLLAGEITLHDHAEFAKLRAEDPAVPWLTFDPRAPLELDGITRTSPSSARLALLALSLPDEAVWSLEEQPLEPCYLAAPFVTKAKTRGN